MKKAIISLYRFLPVQLFLLHFRKYQLLLIFWIVLFATIAKRFAVHFGAESLFLSPEYLGEISIMSFFLLGGATAIFSMSWHITTFIIHSKRLPFLGTTRNAFLKYCINNALIPLLFLLFYGIYTFKFLLVNETFTVSGILFLLLFFYLGYILILVISFSYFFRVDRDILKSVLSSIANPSLIRSIIPYDSLDREYDLVKANSYLDRIFRIKKVSVPYQYNNRLISIVLRRHHRNAMFAVLVAFVLLLLLGVFMDEPVLRIPAGAGFLLLFTVMIAVMGAFKYFLHSWEIIGWLSVVGIISLMTHFKIFDLRSIAYGMKYDSEIKPEYDYNAIKNVFTADLYNQDKQQEIKRLDNWLATRTNHKNALHKKPSMIVLSVSGGGSRSAYWTFRALQYADSLTNGQLFENTIMISGASGGMVGAAYWRAIHTEYVQNKMKDPYLPKYQNNIGKDLLNAVVFSLAAVDFISPFNKITVAGRRYTKDRGYAFDRELASNTDGMLNTQLKDYQMLERDGISPLLLLNGTIINDGRKILISSQPVGYLTRSANSLDNENPVIDGIDFARFFKDQDPMNLNIASAIRMSATFPIILPIVKLPSEPYMNVMDAGLRDNYGEENASRYLHTFRDWIDNNLEEVIYLQIRDTKQEIPAMPDNEETMSSMLLNPIFAIQNKWSSFQTFHQSYIQDFMRAEFKKAKFHHMVIQYIPFDQEKSVALNFHLTSKEKSYLNQSIYNERNQKIFTQLKELLYPTKNTQEAQNQKNELSH